MMLKTWKNRNQNLEKKIKNFRKKLIVFCSADSAVAMLKVICFVLFLLFYCHMSACMQYMVPVIMEYHPECWIKSANLQKDLEIDLLDQYSWSLFRAVSHMLCIGKSSGWSFLVWTFFWGTFFRTFPTSLFFTI